MEKLRFMHIPKTAGTTFEFILHRFYKLHKTFAFSGNFKDDIKKYKSIPIYTRQKICLFTGHAPIHIGIPEIDKIRIITFLRHPIERVKSFCQHVSEGKSPYLLKDFPPESFNLDTFLNSGNRELSNLITKMLINEGSCTLDNKIKEMSKESARDLALENLFNKVACFGIQEKFDESLIIMKERLKWNWPFYLSKNIKNPNRLIHFKRHHLDKIAELNSIDMAIYENAYKKFKEQLNSIPNIQRKLILFKKKQSLQRIKIKLKIENIVINYTRSIFHYSI